MIQLKDIAYHRLETTMNGADWCEHIKIGLTQNKVQRSRVGRYIPVSGPGFRVPTVPWDIPIFRYKNPLNPTNCKKNIDINWKYRFVWGWENMDVTVAVCSELCCCLTWNAGWLQHRQLLHISYVDNNIATSIDNNITTSFREQHNNIVQITK